MKTAENPIQLFCRARQQSSVLHLSIRLTGDGIYNERYEPRIGEPT